MRRLEPADAADFRAIRLAALQSAPEAFGSTWEAEKDRPPEAFAERIRSCPVFGAYLDARIVGMIGLRQETGAKTAHKGFLWGFYVEPAARGMGFGNALVAAALGSAQEIVEQVTLTVVADNAPAIALYGRFGFRRYGTEPRALKTEAGYADEHLMALILSERDGTV